MKSTARLVTVFRKHPRAFEQDRDKQLGFALNIVHRFL